MIMKGRSPTMRHVSRTHRVAKGWLFDTINLDPKIQVKYVDTTIQLADILTKWNVEHLVFFNVFLPPSCPFSLWSDQEAARHRVAVSRRQSLPRTKMTRAPCRRRTGEAQLRAEKFVDLITTDHKVLNEDCESRNNHRHAVVVQDLATQWNQSYPWRKNLLKETEKSVKKFLGLSQKPKVIYTDNSWEFGKSCEDLSWTHRTSTLHQSETIGFAERAVRRVKEGTSAVLQSGSGEKWWTDSMECYCYLRIVQDLMAELEKLHMKDDSENHSRDRSFHLQQLSNIIRFHQEFNPDFTNLARKFLPGINLGYASVAGECGKEIFWLQICKIWKTWSVRNPSSKNQCKRSVDDTKVWIFNIPSSRW